MVTAHMHGSLGKARNAARVRREQSKPKRIAGSLRKHKEDPQSGIGGKSWHDMVSSAAYFRAESRGFEGGSADDDWYEAEAELREQLAREEGTEAAPVSGASTTDIEREGE